MNPTKENAAGALPTPGTAQENTQDHSTVRDKQIATLTAKFALNGHSVHELSGGGFVVTRPWCGSRFCADYSELVNLGRVVGVL